MPSSINVRLILLSEGRRLSSAPRSSRMASSMPIRSSRSSLRRGSEKQLQSATPVRAESVSAGASPRTRISGFRPTGRPSFIRAITPSPPPQGISRAITSTSASRATTSAKHSRPLLADATRKPLLKKKCRSSSRRRHIVVGDKQYWNCLTRIEHFHRIPPVGRSRTAPLKIKKPTWPNT